MTALYLAFSLALLTAAAHSVLSERLLLRPLRKETAEGRVFSPGTPQKLATAMFHLPSVCWAAMAASMLLLEPSTPGYRETLLIYSGVYALSGIGNFWAVGKPHPGGILLLSTSALILASLYG